MLAGIANYLLKITVNKLGLTPLYKNVSRFILHSKIIKGIKTHEFQRKWNQDKSVREFKRTENKLHPTMKPVELIWNAILNSSKKWDLILDLFAWSWSTLIACEQLDRKCYTMEIDPVYIEVIIKRFHKINPDAEIKCVNREININEILSDEK